MRVSAVFLFFCVAMGPPAAAQAQIQPDACALLTPAEVSRVQRQPITDTSSSKRDRKGFHVSQCFYTAKLFEKSVSLEVTRPDAASATPTSPRQDWDQIFHAPKPAAERHQSAARGATKKEAKSGKPARIKGLGEEAFWVSDAVAGALYVLKGDAYFRLSIGGWANQSQRLGKTKQLARHILKRL